MSVYRTALGNLSKLINGQETDVSVVAIFARNYVSEIDKAEAWSQSITRKFKITRDEINNMTVFVFSKFSIVTLH